MSQDTAEFMQHLASAINSVLNGDSKPAPHGFVLLVFPFDGPKGARTNYVSNADRSTMLAGLKEIVARFEGRYQEADAGKVS